jgi:hypothetical protein
LLQLRGWLLHEKPALDLPPLPQPAVLEEEADKRFFRI